ncbi:MAG: molecular chaperone DnaJ, partial [Betaproteobacteria bacterium]
IKKAYRKLAHKYHPDVSKDPQGETKFKEIAEAYATLKDPEKRAAYDQLGRHAPGEDFRPPPDWGRQFGDSHHSFEDIDLSDLFAEFFGREHRAGGRRGPMPIPGEDYEVTAHISLEDAYRGATVDLELSVPEFDGNELMRRVSRSFKARIPKGATDGHALHPHPLFRASGHDLYLDLPLAPWEAVLGAAVQVPTLGGPVQLKVPPGTQAGQKLRLANRGLPKPHEGAGDLYAIVQIVVPGVVNEKERALFRQLADSATFNPRGHFEQGAKHERQTH